MIEDLKKRLSHQSIGIKLTPAAKNYLIEQGYDPKNGARPLRRAIENQLESLLSEAIISESIKSGQIAVVDLVKKQLKLKIETKES